MSEIRSVQLELLRHGPAYNQLLSPLTPYLALCGGDGPVTIHMPFEQRQLLNRLERLRYSTEGKEISGGQREGEVREMGEVLGRVLGQVPALLSELGNARAERGKLVHFRLSLSAFELGLVPFEVAIAPDGFPGIWLSALSPIATTDLTHAGDSPRSTPSRRLESQTAYPVCLCDSRGLRSRSSSGPSPSPSARDRSLGEVKGQAGRPPPRCQGDPDGVAGREPRKNSPGLLDQRVYACAYPRARGAF